MTFSPSQLKNQTKRYTVSIMWSAVVRQGMHQLAKVTSKWQISIKPFNSRRHPGKLSYLLASSLTDMKRIDTGKYPQFKYLLTKWLSRKTYRDNLWLVNTICLSVTLKQSSMNLLVCINLKSLYRKIATPEVLPAFGILIGYCCDYILFIHEA